jgi:hypothetical protein
LRRVLLNKSGGTRTTEYIEAFIPKRLALLKPENVEAVKNIMMDFASKS